MLEFSDSLGWGVRACAAALTVGKDLCTLSIRGKCEEKVGKDLLVPFPSKGKGTEKKFGLIFWLLSDYAKSNRIIKSLHFPLRRSKISTLT